jgi:hypothetical protein
MDRPTKREWLDKWLDGLEPETYTGDVTITLHVNRGTITRLKIQPEISGPPVP